MVSVLPSASVERCFDSRRRDFFKCRPCLARFRFLAKIWGYFHSRVPKLGGMVHGYALKIPRGRTRLDSGITHLSIYPISLSCKIFCVIRLNLISHFLLCSKKYDLFSPPDFGLKHICMKHILKVPLSVD